MYSDVCICVKWKGLTKTCTSVCVCMRVQMGRVCENMCEYGNVLMGKGYMKIMCVCMCVKWKGSTNTCTSICVCMCVYTREGM